MIHPAPVLRLTRATLGPQNRRPPLKVTRQQTSTRDAPDLPLQYGLSCGTRTLLEDGALSDPSTHVNPSTFIPSPRANRCQCLPDQQFDVQSCASHGRLPVETRPRRDVGASRNEADGHVT